MEEGLMTRFVGLDMSRRCCIDWQDGRVDPSPDRGSGDAVGIRASQLSMAVESWSNVGA